MSDDDGRDDDGRDLMEALAMITRDERLRDELERMAAGRLSAERIAALERRAGSDEELRAAIELCRPRPTQLHHELARAALATLAAADPTDRPSEPAPSMDELAARRDGPRPAIRAGHRRALWGAAIAGLAAAAAVLLVMRGRPGLTAALPEYTLEVAAATELRAGPAPTDPPPADPPTTDPIELSAGGRLQIVLRPAVRAAGPVRRLVLRAPRRPRGVGAARGPGRSLGRGARHRRGRTLGRGGDPAGGGRPAGPSAESGRGEVTGDRLALADPTDHRRRP